MTSSISTSQHSSPQGIITAFSLQSRCGTRAVLLTYGATLQEFHLPLCAGYDSDIVCGYLDSLDYLRAHPYHGAVIGPFANRISQGDLCIGRDRYQLTLNEENHHLHGGTQGLHRALWDAESAMVDGTPTVRMTTELSDGIDGYPGDLLVEVCYQLTDDGALDISYTARSSRDTVINLTHHAYWNLAGHDAGTLRGHKLQIKADSITERSVDHIPTGSFMPVEGSVYDYRESTAIMDRLSPIPEVLRHDHGYDCNYVLDSHLRSDYVAELVHSASGRRMKVHTDEPGLQLYTANHLPGDDGQVTKHGSAYRAHGAICLETQHFPDSPHFPNFPSTLLQAGNEFTSWTRYGFTW